MSVIDQAAFFLKEKPDIKKLSKKFSNDLILKHHKEDLEWDTISDRICLYKEIVGNDIEFLQKHPELHKYLDWHKITFKHINKQYKMCEIKTFIPGLYPTLPWDCNYLTGIIMKKHSKGHYCGTCFDPVVNYPMLNWDCGTLSTFPEIKKYAGFIESTPDLSWNWNYLTDILSLRFIIDHPQFKWKSYEVYEKLVIGEYIDDIPYMNDKYNKMLIDILKLPSNVSETILLYLV
jgi:hypothetical protein